MLIPFLIMFITYIAMFIFCVYVDTKRRYYMSEAEKYKKLSRDKEYQRETTKQRVGVILDEITTKIGEMRCKL